MATRHLALGIWIAVLATCAVVVARTPVRTDMAAFLPHSNSISQQVLADQMTNGAASHLILLAIEGASPTQLASLSEAMAEQLRGNEAVIEIANGGRDSFSGVRNFLWRNRYLLSPDVTPNHFTLAGLHTALENDLGLLGSDLGELIQGSLPSDPTGELMTLIDRIASTSAPQTYDGVWFSNDGKRALLLVYTRAAAFDIDAQQHALAAIRDVFDQARTAVPAARKAKLLETGPGVFAVDTRDMTKQDVTRLSLLAAAGAVCFLLFAYRSLRVVLLGLLPVASGVLVAITAVSVNFGFVHGVTLGFGVTLIGESIDYAIYVFTQTVYGDRVGDTLARIWPTLRLGALTSIVGFSTMLFSSFVGFAQLGVFSIGGLLAAAGTTRFVLPHLVPRNFFATGADVLARPLLTVMQHRRLVRLLIMVIMLAALAALATHRGRFWNENISDVSPIPTTDQTLDKLLRHDLGISDLRYFVVFRTKDEQQALEESEVLAGTLSRQLVEHRLGSFRVPSMILPSDRIQALRQAAIPDRTTLQARFDQALADLPFATDIFEPFLHDVVAAKTAPLVTLTSLPPALSLQLQSMLVRQHSGWIVIAPLHGVIDPTQVGAAIAALGPPGARLVDLHHETDQLLHTFQREATALAAIGSLAILAVLLVGLRSPRRVARVVVPLAAAVLVTAALLSIGSGKFSIFMIFGFLLIVAVGSNYCLFFERLGNNAAMQRRSVASVVLANLCTVSAYGLMSCSRIPVLHDIGITVATGTLLSLFFAAALGARGIAAPVALSHAGSNAAQR
jgi:predicted exporter